MKTVLLALVPAIITALVVMRVVPRKTSRLPEQEKLDRALEDKANEDSGVRK